MTDFKGFVSVGDILVAINEKVVLEEGFEEVSRIVKQLMYPALYPCSPVP